MNAQSAQENFDSYVNKLFFDLYSVNPDSTIYDFIKEFAPVFLDHSKKSGGWTVYGNDDFDPGRIVTVTHSLFFKHHPFIDVKIKEGEFKIYTTRYSDPVRNYGATVTDVQVILRFENSNEGAALFEKLKSDLSAIGDKKYESNYEDQYRRFYEIYGKEISTEVPMKVKLSLTQGHDNGDLCQLTISII